MNKRKKGETPSDSHLLHHDTPEIKAISEEPALKTDAPILSVSKITVKLAACGLLLENELKRQKTAGLVQQYGQLVLAGTLLKPNKIYVIPKTTDVIKAIEDGWIVDMGIAPTEVKQCSGST